MTRKHKYYFNWDMTVTDPLKKALWMVSQLRQLALYNKNLEIPDIGTDEMGSSMGFDWWLLLEYESRTMLDKYNIPREKEEE